MRDVRRPYLGRGLALKLTCACVNNKNKVPLNKLMGSAFFLSQGIPRKGRENFPP